MNGDNASIDGKKVSYLKANFVIRTRSVPAGKHNIEFTSEPKVWGIGEKISPASSLFSLFGWWGIC